MKVIISHDVDHLYPSEHVLTDLFFPKLWVRSLIEWLKGYIGIGVVWNRFLYILDKRMNRIPEICEFDLAQGVRATYFFGMENVLGMSYKKEKAFPWIEYVKNKGFDAGVHGCDYVNQGNISKEHDAFVNLTGDKTFGIRNHYVRYDKDTFNKMNYSGYLFDSTEFNKEELMYKDPYKVGSMWEFPLSIMDGYVLHHDLNEAKEKVRKFINETQFNGGKYLTILFHDLFYNEKCYPVEKAFYEWLIFYIKEQKLEFITFKEAIKELENEG